MKSKDDKKTANTKLKNFIHPILVKKSYLYLGTPPLIKTRSAIRSRNFTAITIAYVENVLSKKLGQYIKIKLSSFKTK